MRSFPSRACWPLLLVTAPETDVFDWIAIDEHGDRILCPDEFFYVPCYSNPGFRTYFKRVLTTLVTEVRTDLIHLDWFPGAYSEPTACCCDHCAANFRTHLEEKYADLDRRQDRLGYTDLRAIRPPRYDSRPIQKNPLVQEWTDFRCLLAADFVRDMSEHLYALNPEVAVDLNAFGLGGWTTQYRATDHPRILPHSHGFWDESDHFAHWTDDDRLISKIRTYKVARLLRNGVFKLSVDASPGVVVELLGKSDSVLLHLVNYRDTSERDISITLWLDELYVADVTCHIPGGEAADLPFQVVDDRLHLRLPQLDTYALIHVSLATGGIRE